MFVLLAWLAGCSTPSEGSASRQIDSAALAEAMAAGSVPLLLDVRTPGEFASGHLHGAVNIPVSELQQRLPELATHKDSDIYVICEAGSRSKTATRLLAAEGFRAVDVTDGMSGARRRGLPTE